MTEKSVINSFHFIMQHLVLANIEVHDQVKSTWVPKRRNRDRYWMSLGPVKHHSVGVGKVGDTLSTCERLPIQSMFFRQGPHILSDLVSGIMTLFLCFLSFWILWTEYFLWFCFISFIALLAVPLCVLFYYFLAVVLQFIICIF